jgi:hypothetical protein
MAKRKPGRPRKVEQSMAESAALAPREPWKRKPGRPRKIAAVETKPSTKAVAEYAIETGDNFHVVEADGFAIASNGDLCMTRGDELVAAFRGWESIVKSEKEAVEPPKAELPEVTLSNAGEQLAGSLIASQYAFNSANTSINSGMASGGSLSTAPESNPDSAVSGL